MLPSRLAGFAVLITTISIAFSKHTFYKNNYMDQANFFSGNNNTKVIKFFKVPSVKTTTKPALSYYTLKSPQLQGSGSAAKYHARGWGWSEDEGGSGGGGGGSPGWGGWTYSHTTYGKRFDMNTLIGAMSLLGLLGVALYGYSRPASGSTTIMMMNMTGRRRRSVGGDDDEDEEIDGESTAEFLSRIAKYLGASWKGKEPNEKVKPFQLY